jgi:phage tail-like protein
VDPIKNFFAIEIEGSIMGKFRECSSLTSKIDVIEYREGGERESKKLPGKVTYSPIVLKWGATTSNDLYKWHKKAVQGQVERKSGSVILYSDDFSTELVRWNFINAWPSEFSSPVLNADKSNEVAVESMTLVCERIERGE